MTSRLPVRAATVDELDAVATLHRQAFPAYQSTQLGSGFCRRLLRAYHDDPEAVVLVAPADGGGLGGYLVGAPPANQRAVNDRLVGWAVLASIGAAARSPRAAAAKAVPAARRARRSVATALARLVGRDHPDPDLVPTGSEADAEAASPSVTPADVRVVLVAVTVAARGTGRADDLLGAFARWAAGRGHRRADLSVIADNAAACRAYERNGWVAGPLEGGGSTARYWLELDSASS